MPITVRQATQDDATELARLLDLFDGMALSQEQVAARLLLCRDVLTTFLGELDGRPVGFACLRLIPHLQGDGPYAELTDLFVEAPHRRQGVARALLAHVEGVAREAGAGEIALITGFDNPGAQAAYRASGYTDWALAMAKRFPAG
jgi:GNAT superfamily N-acetyltransferase